MFTGDKKVQIHIETNQETEEQSLLNLSTVKSWNILHVLSGP